MMRDLKEVLDLVSRMALILLGSGAEISRVEETLQRMADHFEVDKIDMFVIANGLFVNMKRNDEDEHVKIQYVPDVSANMADICKVNALSRALSENCCSFEEALRIVEEIERYSCKRQYLLVVASGVGAAAFCYLFGGNWRDCTGAGICGLILWLALLMVDKLHLSRVLLNIFGAFLVTAGCVLFYKIGLTQHFDKSVMGAVIPLIPGVAFMNGVRDIADGDLISGGIRLLDAIMIFICIAAGVGIALHLWSV